MSDKMDLTNLEIIKNSDEVKFVICSRDDYEWSKEDHLTIRTGGKVQGACFPLASGCFSPGTLLHGLSKTDCVSG